MDDQGVYVFEDDKRVAEATLVSMKDNAHLKRVRSPFSLTQEKVKEDQDHV